MMDEQGRSKACGVEVPRAYIKNIYEAQMIKICASRNHLVPIVEEIIEYNADLKLITGYCVIVERHLHSLSNILTIWNNE